MPGQMSVDDLGNILEAVKRGQVDNAEAGGARFQFVDVREEDELKQAKLDGEIALVGRKGTGQPCLVNAGIFWIIGIVKVLVGGLKGGQCQV